MTQGISKRILKLHIARIPILTMDYIFLQSSHLLYLEELRASITGVIDVLRKKRGYTDVTQATLQATLVFCLHSIDSGIGIVVAEAICSL